MNKKIHIDLTGVPQTLLMPLIGRAKYSRETYSPIHDEKAIEIVNSLDYDFDHLLQVKNVKQTTLFWMARAYHFDCAIKQYLQKYPDALIVNLGCGLDTTFNRVDNGKLTWVDLDLPDVIELRKQILPPSQREHYIAKSIVDFSWIDDVKKYNKPIFFFAGGLFMYFTDEQVKEIFNIMSVNFPGGELIFDNISPKGLAHANKMLQNSNMKNALLQWSIADGNEIEKWSPNYKVVSVRPYFFDIKNKFKFPLSSKFIMYIFDYFHASGIIHIKFQ